MHFTFLVIALFFLIGAAFAQTAGFDVITKPARGEAVAAGTTYNVNWAYNAKYPGNVILSLLGGASDTTLQKLSEIGTASSSDGSFLWAVDSKLGTEATYGIQITSKYDKNVFQYSFPFKITPTSGSSSPSGTSARIATVILSSFSHSSTFSSAQSATPSAAQNQHTVNSTTTLTSATPFASVTSSATANNLTMTFQSAATPTAPGSSSEPTSTTKAQNSAGRIATSSLALLSSLVVAMLHL